jgi:hypothetical protein
VENEREHTGRGRGRGRGAGDVRAAGAYPAGSAQAVAVERVDAEERRGAARGVVRRAEEQRRTPGVGDDGHELDAADL